MTKDIKRFGLGRFSALMLGTAAAASSGAALAAAPPATTNFSTVADNMQASISSLPGLLSALAYLLGVILGVLGVLKIKDHVENPSQTPIKDGAIRLAAGGALFTLPFLFDAMQNTIGEGAGPMAVSKVKKATVAAS